MILHVDMDAFYASVEERDQPALVGKPVIVGGSADGRGVVAAANYVVRKFGVHSAMPTAQALRLCPQAILIQPRMGHYADISDQIRSIFDRYTPLVEPLSLDEAFLDVTGSEVHFGPAIEIARQIKAAILSELALIASIGVAPNKFLAKIASDLKKPDALVFVDPLHVQEFLDPLPVARLWGAGRVTQEQFQQLGIRTISELRRLVPSLLRAKFGSQGEKFWELAHGRDDRRVIPDQEAKSISHETTFAADVSDLEVLRAWLLELTEHVCRRMRRRQLVGRTVQLKLRFSNFQTITRSVTLQQPTHASREVWNSAAQLLESCWPNNRPVRLIGVGMASLQAPQPVQLSLFEDEDRQKNSRLDSVADDIRQKFGTAALSPGSGLLHNAQHRPEPRPRKS
jgi:DNA polymerase IV